MPTIVGRDVELAAIRRLLTDRDVGPGGLFLYGPAGIGKSRLWLEGVRLARSGGVRVLATRPSGSDARVAFGGLRDLLREASQEVLPVLPPPQCHALAVALLEEEPGPTPLDPDVVSASFAAALRLLGRSGRLLIAVDDAQWLDRSSRAALAFALRRIGDDQPSKVLATVRTERDLDVDDLVSALSRECVERCDVGPLTVGALYQLVLDRFGLSLARPVLMRLHELSGGSPLFALELARNLSEHDQLSAPREMSDLLRRRSAALSPPTQLALLIVAALARPTRALLQQIDADVDAALEEAAVAGIVETDFDVIRFTHPLLASQHYAAASEASRRDAHRRIADATWDVEERARHLALAAPGVDAHVAEALDDAVVIARGRGALASAAELAGLAVAKTPSTDPAMHRRELAAVTLYFSNGDVERADQMLSASLARDMSDHQRAELLLEQGRVAYERDLTKAIGAFREALDLAGDDAVLRVEVLVAIAEARYDEGVDGARACAEEAVRIAEDAGDARLEAIALGAAAFLEFDQTGDVPEERFRRAIALEEAAGMDPAGRESALSDYGRALLNVWDLAPARDIFERLVALARTDGRASLAEHLCLLAYVELCAGNLDRAATLSHEAVDVASQTGRATTEVYALFRLGWIEGLRGDVSAARRSCEHSVQLATETCGFLRGARLSLGYLESSLEHYSAAWSFLDPANPATGEVTPGRLVEHVPEMVEVLAALGRTNEARSRLEPLRHRAETLRLDWAVARATHCMGLILAAEGDLQAAEHTSVEAVDLSERNGWPLPSGRALLALGSVQRRRHRKGDARVTLERAVATFDAMGAVIWCERARCELARIGGRSAPAGDRLSATESRIVELVATGRSNKEVAAVLHVSPKTVEWNLSKVYRKLGVRSRTELTARIAGE